MGVDRRPQMFPESGGMTFDPMTQERIAWRARCEYLAAQHLAANVVDVREQVVELDALDLTDPVVEQLERDPAA